MEAKLTRAAIGRTANIGDLYDARSDNFCGVNVLKRDSFCTGQENNKSSQFELLDTDSLAEKFSKLNVDPELQISVFAGLFPLVGSGKFLQNDKTSARSIKRHLHYSVNTETEQIDMFSEELKGKIAIDSLAVENATHVVVEICWGANTFISAEHKNLENKEPKEINDMIESQLMALSSSISEGDNEKVSKVVNRGSRDVHFTIFGDILPQEKESPLTINDIQSILLDIPALIHRVNTGKGMPVSYKMVPVATLRKQLLKMSNAPDCSITSLDECIIRNFHALFENILFTKQNLNDLYSDMKAYEDCIHASECQSLSKLRNDFLSNEKLLRSKLFLYLVPIRSGRLSEAILRSLLSDSNQDVLSPKNVMKGLQRYARIDEKLSMVKRLKKQGVQYVGRSGSIGDIIANSGQTDLYVLYYSEESKDRNPSVWETTWEMFTSIPTTKSTTGSDVGVKSKHETGQVLVFVDADISPNSMYEQSPVIKHYRNGKVLSNNCIKDYATTNFCAAICLTTPEVSAGRKPKKVTNLQLPCPGVRNKSCETSVCIWKCPRCEKTLLYGFDNYVYCSCGRSRYENFSFKCMSATHGPAFLYYDPFVLDDLMSKLTPAQEINILILGETGVGKSTWINGFVNYITYSTLEDAEQGPSVDLIPATFTMTDENYEEIEICTGKETNEHNVAGQSATQYPKSYVFHEGNRIVRIIDTPGIGDTRGMDQDRVNFENIMMHLSHIDQIHGICILLKPNNARLTVTFTFCIKELLTHLHRDASRNIVFCFTNARSTFYQPGDTLPALRALLQQNKEVNIPLSKNTIYCVDNEAVRFLAALKHGLTFDESTRQNYSASWEKSVVETDRLFKHIESLQPHRTKNTLSLNEARRVIVAMTDPMARISKNIDDNISVVREKQNELSTCKKGKKQLIKRLNVPVIDLDPIPLGHPRTVCTAAKCTKVYKVGREIKTEYTQHCHSHCHLRNVTPSKHPTPELKNCKAMAGESQCRTCGCLWDKHMHVTYECRQVRVQVTDETVQELIDGKIEGIKAVEAFMVKLEDRIKTLNGEHAHVIQVSSKFAHFLRRNAITPYNDAMEEYLSVLIRQEKDKISLGASQTPLQSFERMLVAYKNEVLVLDSAMKNSTTTDSDAICPDDISRLVTSLYELPLSGKSFQELMRVVHNVALSNAVHNEVRFERPKSAAKSQPNPFQRSFIDSSVQVLRITWNKWFYA